MNEFFTWEALGSCAGSVLATTLVTQLFKEVSFLKKVPTRVVSYAVAFVLLLLSSLFTGGLNLSAAALCLVNAAVVSLASNGAYDAFHTLMPAARRNHGEAGGAAQSASSGPAGGDQDGDSEAERTE